MVNRHSCNGDYFQCIRRKFPLPPRAVTRYIRHFCSSFFVLLIIYSRAAPIRDTSAELNWGDILAFFAAFLSVSKSSEGCFLKSINAGNNRLDDYLDDTYLAQILTSLYRSGFNSTSGGFL
jgi:hypothetical protein